MKCKVCERDDLYKIEHPTEAGDWYRCYFCGSDSNFAYEDFVFDSEFAVEEIEKSGDWVSRCNQLTTNADLFDNNSKGFPGRDFLDVGYFDGSSLSVMQSRGWSVHGWDRSLSLYREGCSTISESFSAYLFPRRYDGVLSREVIEHVPDWYDHITELVKVTKVGGLLQIQTPRTSKTFDNPTVYQSFHSHIYSPLFLLDFMLNNYRVRLLESLYWEAGQCLLFLKVNE